MSNPSILDTLDPEIVETLVSRREAIARGAKVSTAVAAGLALGSAPIALGTLATTAYAQAPAQILNVLQYALLLENLEAEFYNAVLGRSSSAAYNAAFAPVRATVTPTEAATFELIRQHENAHVAFLRRTITALGGTPANYSPANFDFTGGKGSGVGPFRAATTDKGFLLLVTQVVEDTGVRAYKGQAGNVISNNTVLQAALQIHSVEARHAAKVRRMRRLAGGAPDVVRLSGTIRGTGAAAAGATGTPPQAVVDAANRIYGGALPEGNTTQGGVNVTTLANITGGMSAVQEAFDEPLTAAEVVAIVDPFIVTGTQLPALPPA